MKKDFVQYIKEKTYKVKRLNANMSVKVCHCQGSEEVPIDDMTAIEYWRKHHRGNEVSDCPACGAQLESSETNSEHATVGGHVIAILDDTAHVCITPVCRSCNAEGKPWPPFSVKRSALVLVPKDDETALLAKEENKDIVKKLKGDGKRHAKFLPKKK